MNVVGMPGNQLVDHHCYGTEWWSMGAPADAKKPSIVHHSFTYDARTPADLHPAGIWPLLGSPEALESELSTLCPIHRPTL
jgi:hypothetical protein